MAEEYGGFKTEVLSVRRYKAGYEVRTQRVTQTETGDTVVMKTAYTPTGNYIGSSKWAHRLIVKLCIVPELIPDHRVCSIGFSESQQKWFGWSHRAIYGFAVGDVVKEGDCCAMAGWTDEYIAEHPEEDRSLPVGFVAASLDDCRQMAIAFAESVG